MSAKLKDCRFVLLIEPNDVFVMAPLTRLIEEEPRHLTPLAC
jgi:hypothetical protein